MAYTLDTTLGELIDDDQAKVILDSYVPGASSNPIFAMARGMTLNAVVAMPQAAALGFTKAQAEALLVEVNKRVA
jgi:hypothetical protein